MAPRADVQDLARHVREAGGVYARDLPSNSALVVQVGGRQVELFFGADPADGQLAIRSDSGEDWVIWLHITSDWGCTAGPHSVTRIRHWLAPGNRLYVGPFYFPTVEKIVLQGLDLANPAAAQLQ